MVKCSQISGDHFVVVVVTIYIYIYFCEWDHPYTVIDYRHHSMRLQITAM